MIWVWLISVVHFIRRLLVPPRASDLATIDPNARCPVCGHRDGELCAVEGIMSGAKGLYCLHSCRRCGARFFEKPVVALVAGSVIPAAKSQAFYDPSWVEKSAIQPKGANGGAR